MLWAPQRSLCGHCFGHHRLYTTAQGRTNARPSRKFGTMNTLDMTTPIEQLGMGLDRVAVKEMPSYARLLRHVFDFTGWDASRYRGYRTAITYPVPMIYMNWWFKLPEAPA